MMFRPLPVMSVCTLVLCAFLVRLGLWQADRAHWKTSLVNAYENARSLPPPASLSEALCADPALPFPASLSGSGPPADARRSVRLFGTSSHLREKLGGPGGLGGSEGPGWRILHVIRAPACLDGGDFLLAESAFERADGTARTTTHLHKRQWPPRTAFAPVNNPTANQWYWLEPASIIEHLGLDGRLNTSVYLAGGDGRPAWLSRTPPSRHWGYSATWFAMAAALLIIYLVYHVRHGRLSVGSARIGYVSTRAAAAAATTDPPLDFIAASLSGLAEDGGLYVPTRYPRIRPVHADETYAHSAARIVSALAGASLPFARAGELTETAYRVFAHDDVAPLVQTSDDSWMMELHHGPSLAFKDIAMSFLAQLYDHALSARGDRMTIVCATSGDTGGAAACAFAKADAVDLVILHPKGRISERQRLFMTTTGADNIHNFAVEGDFDACQAIVKTLFADRNFRASTRLSGVNSINWARIAAQSVYFARAQALLGPGPIRFIVPTGNFGDALAAWLAHRCGLLHELDCVIALNANNAMGRLVENGVFDTIPAQATLSPAMDIRLPSNFERLFFEASDRDALLVRGTYETLADNGQAHLDEQIRSRITASGFSTHMVSDTESLREIESTHKETGMLICPHTAVGRAVLRRIGPAADGRPSVVLATAHAAKFPETVHRATGISPSLPAHCAQMEQVENMHTLQADASGIMAAIAAIATNATSATRSRAG